MNHPNNLITNPLIIRSVIEYYRKTKLDDKWNKFIEVSQKPQRKYRAKMKEVFASQLDDILRNINKAIKSTYDAEQIDWNEYRLQLNEFGQLELPGILMAWADLELEALEVGISFDVVNPQVLTAITNRSNLFSDRIVNETRNLLHQTINEGISAGYSIPQHEKRIRLLFENMSKYRSTRIARTEVIWGQNEGAEQGYIQSGVVQYKKWLVAHDERLCPFCAEMGRKDPIPVGVNYFNRGDILTVDNPKHLIFVQTKNGGYHFEVSLKASDTLSLRLDYEDIRHPPIHPHCRCTLIPVVNI